MIDDQLVEAMDEGVERFSQLLSTTQDISRIHFPDGATEKGADFSIKDYKGETIVHIAAKYGHSYLLALFQARHADINDPNGRKRCPLSVATLCNKENAVELLLAFGAEVNSTDEEDMTPLHYAVVVHNIAIAQRLLFAGASRSSPFPGSKSPRDIAEYRSWPDLVSLLTEPSCLLSFHPCKTPIQPLRNSYWNFVAFHLFFVVRYVMVFLIVMPGINCWFLISSFLLGFAGFLMYEIVANLDPGYVLQEGNREERLLVSCIQGLLERYKAEKVCAECAVLMEEGDKHCLYCGQCVRKFDHHCPWLHNCIGAGNQRVFSLFIFLLCLDLAYHSILSCLCISYSAYFDALDTSNPILPPHFFQPQNIAEIRPPLKIAISVLSGAAFFCVFPIFILQVGNLLLDTTTHARFSKKRLSKIEEKPDSDTDEIAQMLIDSQEVTTFHSLDAIEISTRATCCGFCKKERVVDSKETKGSEGNG